MKLKKPEVCSGCLDAIYHSENWNAAEKMCIGCAREKNAKFCLKCNKGKPVKEYWGICKECWNKQQEEIDRENAKVMKDV